MNSNATIEVISSDEEPNVFMANKSMPLVSLRLKMVTAKIPIAIGKAESMKIENGGQFWIHRVGLVEGGRHSLMAIGNIEATTKEIPLTSKKIVMGASRFWVNAST